MHVHPTHGGRAQGMCGGGDGSGSMGGAEAKGRGAGRGSSWRGRRGTGRSGSGRDGAGSEQSARETTTKGACDKQDGRAAERPMAERTKKQLNEQRGQEMVAYINRMTKAETRRRTDSPTQQKSHVFCVF